MIKVSEYKYGEFIGVETYDFLTTEQEVNGWILEAVEDTEEIKRDEIKYGESLCNHTGKFEWKGKSYEIYFT